MDDWVKTKGGIFTATSGFCTLKAARAGWDGKGIWRFHFGSRVARLEDELQQRSFSAPPLEGDPSAAGIWQINTKQDAIGELLQGPDKIVKSVTPPVPAGEWVKFRIEARGTNLWLDVDGKRAWEFTISSPRAAILACRPRARHSTFAIC